MRGLKMPDWEMRFFFILGLLKDGRAFSAVADKRAKSQHLLERGYVDL